MVETLTIIGGALSITALPLSLYALKKAKSASKPQPCVVDKSSLLARRREELVRASMAWLYSRERGLTNTERREEQVMDRLEREVAALEKELSNSKAEGISEPEAPKCEPVDTIRCGCDELCTVVHYKAKCSFCGWSATSSSMYTASALRDEHEMRHA